MPPLWAKPKVRRGKWRSNSVETLTATGEGVLHVLNSDLQSTLQFMQTCHILSHLMFTTILRNIFDYSRRKSRPREALEPISGKSAMNPCLGSGPRALFRIPPQSPLLIFAHSLSMGLNHIYSLSSTQNLPSLIQRCSCHHAPTQPSF